MKEDWETIDGIRLGEAAFFSAKGAILRRQILPPHRGIRCQPRATTFWSANGAATRQPRATPWVHASVKNSGPKVRSNGDTIRPGLQPSILFHVDTQGVALGWLGDGALPRKKGDRR